MGIYINDVLSTISIFVITGMRFEFPNGITIHKLKNFKSKSAI